MEILIADLHPGANRFQATESAETLDLDLQIFSSKIEISTLADLEGRLLSVTHRLTTRTTRICDRCLTPFTREMELTERFLYAIDDPREYDEDVRRISLGDHLLSFDQDLREMLLLALPMKNLCRPDCRGLCPQCGMNLNEGTCDCRPQDKPHPLDALRNLQIKSKE